MRKVFGSNSSADAQKENSHSFEQRLAILLSCACVCSCADGPSLGAATDVVITGRGADDSRAAESCPGFDPSTSDVERFLNGAVIITPYEEHDFFAVGPCFVEGTAVFRGQEAAWEMRSAGTGHVIFYGEVVYRIADERERVDSE